MVLFPLQTYKYIPERSENDTTYSPLRHVKRRTIMEIESTETSKYAVS